MTAEYVAAHLAERYFWLRKADVRTAKDSIRAAFEQYPVSALCPSRGAVVRGPGRWPSWSRPRWTRST